jgi:hypothetical protein
MRSSAFCRAFLARRRGATRLEDIRLGLRTAGRALLIGNGPPQRDVPGGPACGDLPGVDLVAQVAVDG